MRAVVEGAKEGVAVARRIRGLVPVLVILTVSNLVATAPLVAGTPTKAASDNWSSLEFGLVTAALGVGLLVGSFASGWFPAAVRSVRGALVAIGVAALCFAGLAFADGPALTGLFAALGCALTSFAGRVFRTFVLTRSPETHLAKLGGLLLTSIYCGIPLSYLVYGGLASLLSATQAGIVMSVVLLLLTLVALIRVPRDAASAA